MLVDVISHQTGEKHVQKELQNHNIKKLIKISKNPFERKF